MKPNLACTEVMWKLFPLTCVEARASPFWFIIDVAYFSVSQKMLEIFWRENKLGMYIPMFKMRNL